MIVRERDKLLTGAVSGGLAVAFLTGLLVEARVFRAVDNATGRRWVMQR